MVSLFTYVRRQVTKVFDFGHWYGIIDPIYKHFNCRREQKNVPSLNNKVIWYYRLSFKRYPYVIRSDEGRTLKKSVLKLLTVVNLRHQLSW